MTFDKDILTNPDRVKDLEEHLLQVLKKGSKVYKTLNNLVETCILADNKPGIDIVIKYFGRDDPDYAELLRKAANQEIETIAHMYDKYHYCDLYEAEEALLYADFAKLTENNPDPRVKRFVTGLEEFITTGGYIPIYDEYTITKKIEKGPANSEKVQRLTKWREFIRSACNPI